jgi:hypothetical protein
MGQAALVQGMHKPTIDGPAVVDRLTSQASVTAVGLSNALPANGTAGEADYTVEGASLA